MKQHYTEGMTLLTQGRKVEAKDCFQRTLEESRAASHDSCSSFRGTMPSSSQTTCANWLKSESPR